MTLQMTLLGLNQLSASIGLALADQKDDIRRVAYDRDTDILHAAEKMGIADTYTNTLPDAVEKADVVILAEPMEWVRTTLEEIKPDLKPGAVLIDVTPCKMAVAGMIPEIYPEKVDHVGLTLLVSGVYLNENPGGLEMAHADLFVHSVAAVTASEYSSSRAFEAANNLVQWVGADPLYAEGAEVDGLLAAVSLLPQISAAALISAVQNQPGWIESRKFAGPAYSAAASSVIRMDGANQLGVDMLANRENLLRMMDEYICSFQKLRDVLEGSDETALDSLLKSARQDYTGWLIQRKSGKWLNKNDIVMPKSSFKERLLGTGFKKKNSQ
jgi:prephenate dehydrogenase